MATELERLRSEVGEIVAKHDAARARTDFTKYADDPAGFFRDVLRCEPWEMQLRMAELVRDHPRSVVVTGNGLGKDWISARIALWWAFARRGFVILTAPTLRQVQNVLMREVRRAFALAPELPGELYSLELRVSADCGILAFTSDNADRLVGFHHPRLLVCVTEGQGVSDDAYEAARACCTAPENRLFVYGNPTSPTGAFYRAANSDAWASLTVPATLHPNVVTGRTEIPGAVSREWIAAMRDEYGAGSSIYGSRVLAQFPSESVEGLIKRDWLTRAAERFASGALELSAGSRPLTAAIDVSRFGGDKTVMAFAQGPIVREVVSWQGQALTDTAERAIDETRRVAATIPRYRHNPEWKPQIVVDVIGLGAGVADILKSKRWPVHEFNASHKSREPERFLNLRSESHWRLREVLERDEVAIAHNPTLNEEAAAVEWHTNTAGQIQILSKDLIRAALGRSPDTLDAVTMALAMSMGSVRRGATGISTFTIG